MIQFLWFDSRPEPFLYSAMSLPNGAANLAAIMFRPVHQGTIQHGSDRQTQYRFYVFPAWARNTRARAARSFLPGWLFSLGHLYFAAAWNHQELYGPPRP